MIEWLYILVGSITILYLYLTWNHDYWKKRGITYPKPLPGIGNMLDTVMYKKSANFIFIDMYRKFSKEPVCGFFDMCTPALLLRNPEIIQTVLVRDFSSFRNNDFKMSKDSDPYLSRNPFFSTTDWKSNRTALASAITFGKMKNVFPQMKLVIQQMEDYLNNHLSKNIEAKDFAVLFNSDIVANCAFGIQGNSFTDPDHVFKKMFKKMAEIFYNPFKMFAFFTVPKLAQMLKLRMISDEVYKFLENALIEVYDFRRKNNIIGNDFADFILASYSDKDKCNTVMLGHAITFFMEGIETSSIVASFAIFELARNSDVQETLRAEILSNFSNKENLELETLQKLPYLHQVISEILRMYPVGMVLKKLCTQDTTIDVEGKLLRVEKGTPVVIPVYSLHHDPEYFPNPEKFDPERFSKENVSSRPQFSYIPFGEGPRMCLGFRLGLIQTKLFIASILMNYSIHCCDRTSKQVNLSILDVFPVNLEGLWVKFEKYPANKP